MRGRRPRDTRAPPCAGAGRGDRRSASARGPPASPHGPASGNLGSGRIARIPPWPRARGRTARRGAGRCRGAAEEGFPGGVTRARSSRRAPGRPARFRSLGGRRPRARLCEATAPHAAPARPAAALPRRGRGGQARGGAGEQRAANAHGARASGNLTEPGLNSKSLPCLLPSATLCFLAFLLGGFSPPLLCPFFVLSHVHIDTAQGSAMPTPRAPGLFRGRGVGGHSPRDPMRLSGTRH